jgi:outer membrane protein TolC
VTASDALYRLAKDRHDSGVATGVDVLRAQVELANDKQVLLAAQNQYKQTLLSLARNIGMTPGTPLELAEPLAFQPLSRPQIESSISSALLSRPDYLSLAMQRRSLAEQERANHARNYPRVGVSGNYGGLGRSIGSVQGTGVIQGTIDFTIFDRDRGGEAQEIAARLHRIDDQIADLRRGIDQDIREALLNLESTEEQVQVAKEGQNLAQRELTLAQDRFESGVTNNVEVVTAQDSLARAQENYILAVSSHADARFSLSRAMGGTEQSIGNYLNKQ